VWWIHTSTWRDAGLNGAEHTYVELRCGSTSVRVAHRLDGRDARELDPTDRSAHWHDGSITIRFIDERQARAAARVAFDVIAGPDDVLLAHPPDHAQTPLVAPDVLRAATDRLAGGRVSPNERDSAWRWILMATGYDVTADPHGAPERIVVARRRGGYRALAVEATA
jgi:hypothetical protein